MKLSLTEIRELAERLARGGSFGGANAVQLEASILAGQEIGVGPITAACNISVSNGKLAVSASLQAARVLDSNWYHYEVVEVTDERAELRFYNDVTGDPLGTSTFTLAEAARAGLTGKSVWKQYPADLCFARALTRGVRRFCPNVLTGNPAYTAEELGEDIHEPIPAPAPPALPPAVAEPGVTDKQLADLRAAILELRLPADKWTAILTRRGVKAGRDLTEAQASEILAKLNRLISTRQLEEGIPDGKAVAADSRLVMELPATGKQKKEDQSGAVGADPKSQPGD
jgi:hypothetical protein